MLGSALIAHGPESRTTSSAVEGPIDMTQETNHRLANSLQLLSAMVAMTARAVTDASAQAALADTHRRIEAIGRLHRYLYTQRDDQAFDLGQYLTDLGRDLEDGYCDASSRRVLVSVQRVIVPPEDALAIGILVSELVGNACKYAYEPHMPGDIRVVLQSAASGGYHLAVEDRGVGKPCGVSVGGTGIGSRLIEVMTSRLRARAVWQNAQPGTRFLLSVPA